MCNAAVISSSYNGGHFYAPLFFTVADCRLASKPKPNSRITGVVHQRPRGEKSLSNFNFICEIGQTKMRSGENDTLEKFCSFGLYRNTTVVRHRSFRTIQFYSISSKLFTRWLFSKCKCGAIHII
jgi:hypothetical protein